MKLLIKLICQNKYLPVDDCASVIKAHRKMAMDVENSMLNMALSPSLDLLLLERSLRGS